jgi:malonyl-CoA O-methyltransferase
MTLMRDLKTLGAHNVNQGRRRGLTGKHALKTMIEAYEDFRDEQDLLPASYDVIYGVMRKRS